MILVFVTCLLFATLATTSFFVSYYVTVLMNQSTSTEEPRINNTIMTQATILIQTTINAIGDLTSLIASKGFEFVSNIRENLRTYLNLFALGLFLLSYYSNKPVFLSGLDKFWRCGVNPMFVNVIMSILQVVKLTYGAFVPIYNYDVLIGAQLVSGTGGSILLCSTKSLFTSARIVLNIWLNVFKSIGLWSGIAYGQITVNNNLLINELPVKNVVRAVQRLVLQQESISSCVCSGLSEVFEFFYIVFRQDELALAINHAVNVPVSLVQGLFLALPPWGKSASLVLPFNHMMGFVYYLSKWMDQVLMKWIVQLISLFDSGIGVDGLPEEFFITVIGRLSIASLHALWTSVRVAQTFSLTAPVRTTITDSNFQMRSWSMDQAMEHLNLAIIGQTDLIAWGLKTQHALVEAMGNAVTTGSISLRIPEHVHLKCNKGMTNWIERKACALRLAEMLVPDLIYTVYTLTTEILWKSLVNQEENVIQMLQRYDGISHPRGEELTCEYRKSITYDLTSGECRCDHGFGEYKDIVVSAEYPFGKPYFEKYCEQPNLQANHFSMFERISEFTASGFLQNIKDIVEISTLMQLEFWRTLLKVLLNLESIVSGDYFHFKVNCGYGMSSKQLRLWWNSTDTDTTLAEKFSIQRAAGADEFSIGLCDGAGQLPYYNSIQRTWKCKLIDTAIKDMMCMPVANSDGKIVPGFGKVSVDRCQGANRAGCECNWALANFCTGHNTNGNSDDIDIKSEEDCIDVYSGGVWTPGSCNHTYDPMRIYPTDPMEQKAECEDQWNVENTVWTPPRCDGQTLNEVPLNATSQELCEKTTVNGSWTGPIDPLNKCQCIRDFPDDLMVYAQTAFTNPVRERFHSTDVANHWCNTFWIEWQLYYIGKFATVIEKAFGVFHPAYSGEDDGSNPYCDDSAFTLFETKLLRYPLWKYNLNRDLFDNLQLDFTEDSCKLYGTTDFVCSTGLTIRQVVYAFINEIRAVTMSASNLLELDFSSIKLSFSERLCDLARALASFSSIPPSILPDAYVGVAFQKGMSQLYYVTLNMPIAILDALNYVIVFIGDVVTGQLDWSKGPLGPIFKLIFGLFNIGIDWFRMILHGFGNVLNGIESGAGDGLFSFDNIIGIVQKYLLNEAAAELLELFLQVGTEMMEFFTSGTVANGFSNFFGNLWKILQKGVNLLLKNVGRVMGVIMDMLGPVGTFIRNMANDICGLIEDVIGGILLKPSFSLGCGLRHHKRHLFSSGNETSEFQRVMWHVADTMDWNGTSECDMFVHSYKHYQWDDMRPLEHIKLVNCVENRMIMREISKQTNITLPEDLLYNWRRKWLLAKDFAGAAAVYIEHKLGKITTQQMIHKFKQVNIQYDEWLPVMNSIKTHAYNTFTFKTLSTGVEAIFREIDPDIEKNRGTLNSVYRLYDIGKRCGSDVYEHATSHRLRHKMGVAMHTAYTHVALGSIQMPQLPKHLYHGFDTWNSVRISPTSAHKTKARNIVLRAAGVTTDITPCSTDSYVCLNCAVLDNFINVVIGDGLRMANYYENVYAKVTVPDFERYWTNNTESEAWRQDVGISLGKAFENVINDIDSSNLNTEIPEDVDTESPGIYEYNNSTDYQRKLRRPRLFKGGNQSLSYFKRARSDWAWFFDKGWNPLVDHSNDPDRRDGAPTVLMTFLSADEDVYVQYFAHSATYYIKIPFGDCPSSKAYCTHNTFTERQTLIGNAWGYMFWYALFWWVIQYQTGIPVFTLQAVFFLPIFLIIYMITVYEYTWRCVPSLPNCFMDDLYTYIHDNLFPSCFCYYFPGLSQNCNPDTCFLCSKMTEFSECEDRIPLIPDMGMLWAPAFFIRKNFPWLLVFLYKTIPFAWIVRTYDPIVSMTQSIIEGVEIEQVELDCLNISYADIVFMGIAVWFATKVMGLIAPAVIKTVQHATNLTFIYITMIYSMALSLEIQTTNGIESKIDVDGL